MNKPAFERPGSVRDDDRQNRRSRIAVAITALAILAALATALGVLARVTQDRIDRAERAWLQRLDIIAEGRRTAVADWIAAQKGSVAGLADNDTVRLFITQLAAAGYDIADLGQAQAQKTYVSNLLKATARRDGFDGELIGADIPANVDNRATAGLSIVRPNGQPIVTTRGAVPPALPKNAATATRAQFLGRVPDPDNGFALAFIAPIFGIQADPAPGNAKAYVLAYKRAGEALRERLATDVEIAASLRTVLLTVQGERVHPVLAAPALAEAVRKTPITDDEGAFAFSWNRPGGVARRRGPAGNPVLVSARDIPSVPWRIATLVDRDAAVGGEIARARQTAVGLGLATLAAGLAMLALWRHGASVRARAATARYQAATHRLERQRRLLSTVTDNQPTRIIICDQAGTVRFTNVRAAEWAGSDPETLPGKSLNAVFGPAVAERLNALNAAAADGLVSRRLTEADGVSGVWLSNHVPLPRDSDWGDCVLIVQHDISREVAERERRERTLDGLVQAIMTIVDQRDHRSGQRSRTLAHVAEALAHEAGASDRDGEAARLAGLLMNLGKVLVPDNVLARTGPLSADERAQIHASTAAVTDLIADLAFDAPVQATLHQVHEHVDGSGRPDGRRGSDILLPARALAVANAFVGMITDRPDRSALPYETALDELWRASDTMYDRALVGALVNLVRNRDLVETARGE